MKHSALLLALIATSPPALGRHAHHGAGPQAARPAAAVGDAAAHAPAQQPHAGHRQAPSRTDHPAGHAGHDPLPVAPAGPHAGHPGHTAAPGPHAGHAAPTPLDAPNHDLASGTLPLTPIPEPSAADRAAAFPPLAPHSMQHAARINHLLLAERLEAWNTADGSGLAWELRGWWGSDTRRAWLRAEGEREAGQRGEGHIDLLYGLASGPWWETVAGLRHEHGRQPRTRAAFGVQGLAPYRIETRASVVLGGRPRAELELEAEHALRLGRQLVLQPALQARLLARDDPAHGRTRGLAGLGAGLRLRWEVTPRLAPYLGVEHERRFGDAGSAAPGHDPRQTRWVAGLRAWF